MDTKPPNAEQQESPDRKPHVRKKTARCPVCGETSLSGYFVEIASGKIGYNEFFLPVLLSPDAIEDGEKYKNLTLLDNYICLHDLFVYVGKIKVTETPKGTQFDLAPNIFTTAARYYKSDPEPVIGQRLGFVLGAIQYSLFDATTILPPEDTLLDRQKISHLVHYLLDGANDQAPDPEQTYRVFDILRNDLKWDPMAALFHNFIGSRKVFGALLELQLSDLLYIHRRNMLVRKRVTYPELYDTLRAYRKVAEEGGSLDDDLAGNMLFQCLRMAEFFVDGRRLQLLEAAFGISSFLVRVRLRLGANINRNLDKLAGNADVMLYLNIRLGHELGIDNPQEEVAIRLLKRRLNTIGDYAFAGRSPEAVHIARIGGFLKKFVAKL